MKRRLTIGLSWIAVAAFLLVVPTTLAAPTSPPAGVTGMALDGRVELAWQPASGAVAYAVYRGTSQGAITTRVTPPTGAPDTSFADTTVANGTTYFYAVRSIDSGGESANSLVVQAKPQSASCSSGNYVVVENCRPGDTTWNVTNPGTISGFATASSINKGESVDIKVDTTGAFRMEVYRTGYYGGRLGRLFSTSLGLAATPQPACNDDAATGLIDCSNWSVSAKLTTTQNWPSGVYLLRLVRTDNNSDTQVLLAVRDDARPSDLLYGVGFSTYQAYNNYGGRSLYDWNSWGDSTVSGAARAVKVSFNRPFVQPNFASHDWYTWTDLPMVSWLERMGYSVTYTANTDLERHPERVRDHRAYIMAGHDEYWSAGMRSALEQARTAGTSIFSPSGNAIYWKVRFENSPSGAQDRVMVCYKSTQSGGPDPSGIPTGTWRDPAGANNPENALLGSMYVGDNDYGYAPMVVSAAQGADPIWRYTPVANQSSGSMSLGTNLIGWEWDARVSNGREPAGVKVVASRTMSGLILQDAGHVYADGSATVQSVKYLAPSGALVFNAGTNNWSLGLGDGDGGLYEPDSTMQQATTNLIADMGVQPESPMSGIQLDANNPPTVTSRSPADGATGVSPGTTVRATFSRTMDASTITSTSFKLTPQGGTAIAATVSYDPGTRIATLTPSVQLALSKTYTASLATTIRAQNGNPLASAVTWTFTTAATPPSAPTVTATVPTAGATNVSAASTVQATFSRDMDPSTITTASFTLTPQGGSAVATTVSYDPTTRRATLVPSALLSYAGTYTARLTTQVLAADGAPLATDVTWSFGTEASPPPPSVIERTPDAGATGVSVTTAVRATFSRAMNASTITGSSLTLTRQGGSAVAATVSYDAATNAATLTPTSTLATNTTYTVNVSTQVAAADGVPLASAVSWTFTTNATVCPCSLFPSTLQPASQNLSTQDGRGGAGPWSYEMGVKIQVDQPMQINAIRFYKSSLETGTHIGRIWTGAGQPITQVTFQSETSSGWQQQALATPLTLAPNTVYVVSVGFNAYYSSTSGGLTAQVTSGALRSVADGQNGVHGSAAGLFPTSSYNSSNYFVDVSASVASPGAPPTVTQRTPAIGATGVGPRNAVSATFSRYMDPSTITGSSFTLTRQGGTAVAATVAYDPLTQTATLTPSSPLATSTTYTANLAASITAADGVPLAGAVSWTFTTSSTICPCSLFASTLLPAFTNLPTQDGRGGAGPWSYEMGVKIQVDQPMQIDSIRFFKSLLETGTHVGRIWTASGTQVAQVAFQNETGSGWQEQALSTPVILQANTVYVVTVGFNAYYSSTSGGLATQIVAGPLRSVADGQNGVHSSAAGLFPTSTYNSSNYFVDLSASIPSASAAPTVTQRTPASGATGVGVNSALTATFSRAMNPSTLTSSSFTLTPQGGSAVAGTVSYDSATNTATLTPSAQLQTNTTYTANLTSAVAAADGVALASAVSWSFTTSASVCPCSLFPSTLLPAFTNLPTQDGRGGAGPWSYEMGVKIQVDQPMQIDAVRFYKGSLETGTHVGRIWTASGTQLAQVTFQNETGSGWQQQALSAPISLLPNTVYVVSVGFNAAYSVTASGLATQVVSGPLRSVADGQNGVHSSAAGLFPTSSYSSSNYFVDLVASPATVAPPAAPTVTSRGPGAGATGVAITSKATATFSRAMNPSTLTSSSFTLTPQGGSAVAGTVSYDSATNTATLTPSAQLQTNTTYTANLTTTVAADDGVPLASAVSWSFTTSAPTPAPTVTSRGPGAGATGVAITSKATATFSRAMNPSTLTSSSFTLTPQGGSAVAGTVSYDSATNTATLTPSAQLQTNTTYTANLTSAVAAADGVALASAVSWSFTTSASVCPCSLFPSTLLPAFTNLPTQDGRGGAGPWSYEMGVKIQVDQPMQIDAVRFYKGSLETGTHVGRIWTASGTQLAQVTFQNETGSGWQQQALSAPISLLPNTVYVVSVGFNAAYSVTASGLATQVVSGPLRSVADGQNGVHSSAAGLFPTSSYSSSNYFVDLVASPATVAPPAAPTVTSRGPGAGATGVAITSKATATFSRAMNPSTLTSSSFTLTPQGGSAVAGTVSYDSATNTATLTPSAQLQTNTTYTANLTTTVAADDGVPLASAVSWSFTTSASVCPCSLFPSTLLPAFTNLPTQDGRGGAGPWSYEMGVKIQVDQPMQIDAVRFYKGSLETGTHVGRIWTASGTQLAQVTFQNETGSGWQQQALSAPISLLPNTVYVVSVGFNAAYSVTASGLATQVVSGPLRSVADGQNGVHSSAAGLFPTSSYNSGNYFVDLRVSPIS